MVYHPVSKKIKPIDYPTIIDDFAYAKIILPYDSDVN